MRKRGIISILIAISVLIGIAFSSAVEVGAVLPVSYYQYCINIKNVTNNSGVPISVFNIIIMGELDYLTFDFGLVSEIGIDIGEKSTDLNHLTHKNKENESPDDFFGWGERVSFNLATTDYPFSQGKTYYYRFYAKNASGGVYHSGTYSFVIPELPSLQSSVSLIPSESNVSFLNTVLKCSLNYNSTNSGLVQEINLEIGKSIDDLNPVACKKDPDGFLGEVSFNLREYGYLVTSGKHYYRFSAVTEYGRKRDVCYSSIKTFTLTNPGLDAIKNLFSTLISSTQTDAQTYFSVEYSKSCPTEVGLYYGTDTNCNKLVKKITRNWDDIGTIESTFSFSANGISLSPGTKYYYRHYVIQNGETHYSDIGSFTTSSSSPITVSFNNIEVSNISTNNARITARINHPKNNMPDRVGVRLGTTNGNWTLSAVESTSGLNPKAGYIDMLRNLSKYGITLTSGTKYYYQVFAMYGAQGYYSNIGSFSTTSSSVSVIVNPDGGTWNGTTTGQYTKGTTFSLGTPTKEGYKFVGWDIDYEGSGHKLVPWGTPLHSDPSFKSKALKQYDFNYYDNTGNGNIAMTRVAKTSDCPTSSNYMYQIKTTGRTQPGLGGFYNYTNSKANGVFYHVFVAKIPVGYTVNYATNKIGDGSRQEWITSNNGTGEFRPYVYKTTCGSTGTFSSFGYVYLDGPAASASKPVVWYLGYSEVFDATGVSSSGSSYTVGNGTAVIRAMWDKIVLPTNVSITTDKQEYIIGETVTITPSAQNADYYDMSVWFGSRFSGERVFGKSGFNGSVTFTPDRVGTYNIRIDAVPYTGKSTGFTTADCSFTVIEKPHEHTLVHYDAKDPTCTEAGWSAYDACSTCNYTTYAEIPALGHDPADDDAVPATCTEAGLTAGSHCARCGEVLIARQTVDALGHEVMIDEAVPATCTEAGLTAGSHCVKCGSITKEQEVIPALGHALTAFDEKSPSCDEIGFTGGLFCSRCGEVFENQVELPTLDHAFSEWEVTKEPTTTERGEKIRICVNCGLMETQKIGIVITELPVIGEITIVRESKYLVGYMGNTFYYWLEGATSMEYIFYEVASDGSLSPYKSTEYNSPGLSETYFWISDGYLEDGNYELLMRASNETGDTERLVFFAVNNNVITVTDAPELAHVHTFEDEVTEPTCTEEGYTTHICVCGDNYVDSYVPALGHSFIDWYVIANPTCTRNGLEVRYCENCSYFETREIKALRHDVISDNATEPTCTAAGLTAGSHCSRCGEIITAQETIPALGHDYAESVTAATCTEQGFTTHICARCGDVYIDSCVPALGHTWGEWFVKSPATETEEGVMAHKCTRCQAEETLTIPIPRPETSKIVVSGADSRPGDTVTVSISLENNPGICSVVAKVEYDETRLALVSASLAEGAGGQVNIFGNSFAWVSGSDYESDGPFMILTFTVKEDAEEGDAFVTLVYEEGNISNRDEDDVNFTVFSGKVNVTVHTPGDINGDGKVNSKDLTRLLKYLSGENVEVVEDALDVNGDGKVNSKDLTRLLKYLSGENVEIF